MSPLWHWMLTEINRGTIITISQASHETRFSRMAHCKTLSSHNGALIASDVGNVNDSHESERSSNS